MIEYNFTEIIKNTGGHKILIVTFYFVEKIATTDFAKPTLGAIG